MTVQVHRSFLRPDQVLDRYIGLHVTCFRHVRMTVRQYHYHFHRRIEKRPEMYFQIVTTHLEGSKNLWF